MNERKNSPSWTPTPSSYAYIYNGWSLILQSYTLSKEKRATIFARERMQFILRPTTQNRRAYVWVSQMTNTHLIKTRCKIHLYIGSLFKVIYPKYSKHQPYSVAHTIDFVCSKMWNHGLNHGLFLSLFKLIPCPIHWIAHVLAY